MNRRLKQKIEEKGLVYVNPQFDYRALLLSFLANHGFSSKDGDEYTWERIRDSVLPIVVDYDRNEYSCLLTVTSAAAAAASDEVFSDRDLYECMGVPVEMRFKEYREIVKITFMECGYTEEEAEEFLKKPDILQLLVDHYEGYTRFGIGGYSPIATGSCLDLMYEFD